MAHWGGTLKRSMLLRHATRHVPQLYATCSKPLLSVWNRYIKVPAELSMLRGVHEPEMKNSTVLPHQGSLGLTASI